MEGNKRDFDKEAAAWDGNPVRVKLADDVYAAICGKVPLSTRMDVLDFGCGTGLLTLLLAPQVASITGADTSPGMLDVLRAKVAARDLDNVQTLLLEPGVANGLAGPYDLIVSSMTLHHVEHTAPLLQQFHGCLAPGGQFCVADLDPDGGAFHPDSTGVFHNGFDRGALRQLLQEAGFVDISDVTAAELTKPAADGQMRRFTVFLMSGYRKQVDR